MKNNLRKKLPLSFINLLLRRAVLLAINFATINLILARILPVSYIGIFNIANSILAFFSFFSDIGFGAALIQKKEIKPEDLKTTFTIQEILALVISASVILAAPSLVHFYKLNEQAIGLIRALSVSFFLTSLKVIPSILLERNLRFGPLVFVEIVESLSFNSSLIFLSFNNFGISGFTIASLIRSVSGLVLIYILSPWRVGFGFFKASAKQLLNFGIPFQLNSLLALLKDRLVPLVIARIVGSTGVGYITWAQNLSFIPLEIMNIITRITFPAFSRLQEDERQLKEVLEQSIFFMALFFYPLSFGLMALAPSLVTHVVSNKWQPSLPLIYLFSITAFMSTLSTPFTNFLNAVGKIKITLKLMVMWTVLEWLLTPLFTLQFGFIGVAIASSLISLTAIIPVVIIKKTIQVKIIRNIWKQFVAAFLMFLAVNFIFRNYIYNYIGLVIVTILGGLIYFVIIFFLSWNELKYQFKKITSG